VFSTTDTPSLLPSIAPPTGNEDDNDDDAVLNQLSVIIMVCVMLVIFLSCCVYTVYTRHFEQLASAIQQKQTRFGSSATGKVSLLTLSEQPVFDSADAFKQQNTNGI
jgi:hypothetical protein